MLMNSMRSALNTVKSWQAVYNAFKSVKTTCQIRQSYV